MLESIAYLIGEVAAYLAGLLIGRKLQVDPALAQKLGEYLMLAVLVGLLLGITFAYA